MSTFANTHQRETGGGGGGGESRDIVCVCVCEHNIQFRIFPV